MITWNIAQSAVLYCGLLIALSWRFFFPWTKGENWRKWFNHFTILYGLLAMLYIFELGVFAVTAHGDFNKSEEYTAGRSNSTNVQKLPEVEREWPVYWLRALVMCVPACVFITLLVTALQSRTHLREICQDSAVMQHDRVINILALPAVYSVVAMSGLARVYDLVVAELIAGAGDSSVASWKQTVSVSYAEYETCLFVGDLYEAWALYQFGKLTIELLQRALPMRPGDEEASPAQGPSQGLSVHAISEVLWLGNGLFIIVNLVQTGWALYMWIFRAPSSHWEMFEYGLSRFNYAGMVASAAAVYNIHIVERTFGQFIEGYAPYLKFLSVKLLVIFAFWQAPALAVLNGFGVLGLTAAQMKLLQASLIVVECLIVSLVHNLAWSAREQWYANDGEEAPLMQPDGMKHVTF